MSRSFLLISILFIVFLSFEKTEAQSSRPKFKVLSFYTAQEDLAHISFVHEANKWFSEMAEKYHFSYDSTHNWNDLNLKKLSNYQVVIFLDTRPESVIQREAFEKYMKNGGAWMGFHFSAFALTPSAYPQNWNWYHNEFLGSGQYVSNTWKPSLAVLKVEDAHSLFTKGLPKTFISAPNEWYRWERDLRKNPDIKILVAIDSTSFPLGTGPKAHEIWHKGYYPVVWSNTKYKMVYFNMGHNDMDYGGTNGTLSYTFANKIQNRLVMNVVLGLGLK